MTLVTSGENVSECAYEKKGLGGGLTYAHILIVHFCRGIAVVAQLA